MPPLRGRVTVEPTTGKERDRYVRPETFEASNDCGAGCSLCLAPAAAAGCGGDDAPAVCEDLEQLSSDIDTLKEIDLTAGEGAIADVEASLEAITTDLGAVRTDAEAELSEPIAALDSSLDELSTEFDTAKADDELSSAEAQSLLDSLAAVSTSWEALKTAAPDCDLDE